MKKTKKYIQSNTQQVQNVVSDQPHQTTSHSLQLNDSGLQLATIPIYSASHSDAYNKDCQQDILDSVIHIPDVYQNYDIAYDIHTQSIPQEVLESKYSCMDYNNCIQQMASQIGFVLLTPLKLYMGMEKKYKKIPDIF